MIFATSRCYSLVFVAIATISGASSSETIFSDSIYRIFHSCLNGLDFKFENLPMSSDLIRSFVICCNNDTADKRDYAERWGTADFGVDGRDIISMSAADIQSIFELDANMSAMIFSFISDQLTAHLPNTHTR